MLKYQKISVRHLFYQMLFITYDGVNISKYINIGKYSCGVRLLGICTILAVRTLLHKESGILLMMLPLRRTRRRKSFGCVSIIQKRLDIDILETFTYSRTLG